MRQSGPMDSRSGGRPPQVRPRPASSGRAKPVKVRPVTPSPTRLARYRRVERRRSLPLPFKAVLAAAVVLLSVGVLSVASGAVGPMASGIVKGFGGFVDSVGNVVSSPEPTAPPAIADAPSIVPPDEAYTNEDTIDVTVNVPASIVGSEGYVVRLWVTLKDQEAAGRPGGPGRADVRARDPRRGADEGPQRDPGLDHGTRRRERALRGGGLGPRPVAARASRSSSPSKSASSTTKSSVTVKGKTQARSSVRLKNDLNGATITVEAGKDGLFEAKIAVDPGMNTITITSTDPAGNPNTETITVRKGSGSMRVSLTGTAYRFSAKKLPKTRVVHRGRHGPGRAARVRGDDPVHGDRARPGGHRLVRDPHERRTGSRRSRRGSRRARCPGPGLASVLVTTDAFGDGTDRQVLTVR